MQQAVDIDPYRAGGPGFGLGIYIERDDGRRITRRERLLREELARRGVIPAPRGEGKAVARPRSDFGHGSIAPREHVCGGSVPPYVRHLLTSITM